MKNFYVISLGMHCAARYFVTKAGIKPTKANGELSMPFDLAVHWPEHIPFLIKHRFRGYVRNMKFCPQENVFNVYMRKSLFGHPVKVAWLNHDRDLDGDVKKCRKRYRDRIKNFLHAVKSGRPILFVQVVEGAYDPTELLHVLQQCTAGMFRVLFLDVSGTMKCDDARVSVIRCPYPWKGYVWYDEGQRNSLEGRRFEDTMCAEIRRYFDEGFSKCMETK